MSQDHLIKLACAKCKKVNYNSTRNKKKVPEKVEVNKYCKTCQKREIHKEAKK
jgi:large subunit ribosomal protein L33